MGSRTPSSCSPTASRATNAPVALEQPGLLGSTVSSFGVMISKFGVKFWCQVLVTSARCMAQSMELTRQCIHPSAN